MPCGEGVTAARSEIAFKRLCLCECFECDVGFYLPRHEFGCMVNLPCIVRCQAGTEIESAADITLVGVGDAAKDVSVVHGELLLGVSVGVFLVELVLLCSLFLWS